ncbi:MAG: hypothetical protein DRZ79_03005 [Candidatus Cloacimonadota bacterium]|nr:MAG: hypothetical protein DRZ79_03005 [Candidatus Cloacimonadota bacterium]
MKHEKFVVLLALFSLLFSGCSSFIRFSCNPLYVTRSSKYHIVKKGETLSEIADKYSISEQRLRLFNNLKSDRIFPGQKIYLSPKPFPKREFVTPRPIPKTKYYIVKPKESIYRIAKMFNLKLLDLVELNDLETLSLHAGQKLWLEKDSSPQAEKKKNLPKPKQKKFTGEKSIRKPQSSKIEKKMSLVIPVQGIVTSEFGMRNGRMHKGIDIAAKIGDPIRAVADGMVAFEGYQKGYGNVVILEHENFVMTVYAHNETNLVRLGDEVKQGQPIATVGDSGNASGPHLHFEYRIKGRAVNPREVLPKF